MKQVKNILRSRIFYIQTISISLMALCLVVGLSYAWSTPPSAPPAGNVPAPLNTSIYPQVKEGGLIINTGGASTGLIVQKGNVGIGTTNPGAKLDVAGGVRIEEYSPQLLLKRSTDIGGFVSGIQLQNNAGTNLWWFGTEQGTSWQVSKGDYNDDVMLKINNNGNVGIGTTAPGFPLVVKSNGNPGAVVPIPTLPLLFIFNITSSL